MACKIFNKRRDLPVVGVSQPQLPLLVPAPRVHFAILGDGEAERRDTSLINCPDLYILQGIEPDGTPLSIFGVYNILRLSPDFLPVCGSAEEEDASLGVDLALLGARVTVLLSLPLLPVGSVTIAVFGHTCLGLLKSYTQ